MEAASLCLLLTFMLLGLMNPTDLSLVTVGKDGELSLPQDFVITVGATVVG